MQVPGLEFCTSAIHEEPTLPYLGDFNLPSKLKASGIQRHLLYVYTDMSLRPSAYISTPLVPVTCASIISDYINRRN